jgi:Zn-finger nucleic acid-binding protein
MANKKNKNEKKIKENEVNIQILHKQCPKCKIFLSSEIFHNTEVDYCPQCLGLWFDEDELRQAKDEKDKSLKWLDIDLWKDDKNFKIAYGIRICPSCRVPLYEVYYGDSKIVVDVCNLCQGVWLDRGEFKKITGWLKNKKDYEIYRNYAKNLFLEATEIFSGPEILKEEILDFLVIFKLLKYKLITKYSFIFKVVDIMPK